jgi:hypothetical protein
MNKKLVFLQEGKVLLNSQISVGNDLSFFFFFSIMAKVRAEDPVAFVSFDK